MLSFVVFLTIENVFFNLCVENVPSVKAYVLHCKLHRNEPRRVFKCVETSCKQVFSGYTALKSHFYRHHNSTPTVHFSHVQKAQTLVRKWDLSINQRYTVWDSHYRATTLGAASMSDAESTVGLSKKYMYVLHKTTGTASFSSVYHSEHCWRNTEYTRVGTDIL